MPVIVDGLEVEDSQAAISVFDWTVLRGDGCFEAVRSYRGRLFRLGAHLERLARSAAALDLIPPDSGELAGWAERVAEEGGDCSVRIVVTRGGWHPEVAAPSRVIVLSEPLADLPEAFRLLPMTAPWHPGGAAWELAGVKSVSYGPNMDAQRRARSAGFDDALLVGRDGFVLELPTSAIAWFRDGTLETPSLDLGILESITRGVVLEEAEDLGLPIREARFTVSEVTSADEALVMSTLKEVRPISAIAEFPMAVGPLTAMLTERFHSRVGAEVG